MEGGQARVLPGQLEVVPRPLPVSQVVPPNTAQLLLDDHLVVKPGQGGRISFLFLGLLKGHQNWFLIS